MAGTITISQYSPQPPVQVNDDDVLEVRGFYTRDFISIDGVTPVMGNQSSGEQPPYYFTTTPTINGSGNLVVPAHDIQITVGANPTANYFEGLWVNGAFVQWLLPNTNGATGWQIPSVYGDPIAYDEIATYNRAKRLVYAPPTYFTADQTIEEIRRLAGDFMYAAVDVNGITSLDWPPEVASEPIAVGANSPVATMYINVQSAAYGALGNSTGIGLGTDDTAAFQAAIDAAQTFGACVFIPSLATGFYYRITSELLVTDPCSFYSNAAQQDFTGILFDFPQATTTAHGALFNVTADSVHFDGLSIWGAGATYSSLAGNRYAIEVGSDSIEHHGLIIRNCDFVLLGSYSGTRPATTNVTHCIRLHYVNGAYIDENRCAGISGAFLNADHSYNLTINFNRVSSCGWYPIHLDNSDGDVSSVNGGGGMIIGNIIFGSTAANPVYWGGAIDLMGQTTLAGGGTPDKRWIIAFNEIYGTYKYGTAVRLSSARNVVFTNNLINAECAVQNDTLPISYPADSTCLFVVARDVAPFGSNGSPTNILISNNNFIPIGAGQKAIFVAGSSGSGINLDAGSTLVINNNMMPSADSSNYFASALTMVGSSAGWIDITFSDNVASGNPILDTPNNLYAGLVGFSSNGRVVTDGAINTGVSTTTFNSATAAFTASDVGADIQVEGAGTGGGTYNGTIVAILSSTSVTINGAASTTVSGATSRIYRPVRNVMIEDNMLTYFDGAGGAGGSATDSAVYFDAWEDGFTVKGNRFRKFYNGIQVNANVGIYLGLRDLWDNDFAEIVNANVQNDGTPILFGDILGSVSYDFAQLGANSEETVTGTLKGVVANDPVDWGIPAALWNHNTSSSFEAQVTAANTVSIRRKVRSADGSNPSAATINLKVNHK